jgi:hypothetical protein
MSFSEVIVVFVEPRKLETFFLSLQLLLTAHSLPFRPRDTRSRGRGPELHREPHDHGRR